MTDQSDRVNQIVADCLCLDVSNIAAGKSLHDDLGADSLDVVEIGMSLEEEFGIPGAFEGHYDKILTVGDLGPVIDGALR